MISVTKPYLPKREKLDTLIDAIYESGWVTNNGPLVQKLTSRLEEYLGVDNLLLLANGTLALQVAYRALGLVGGVNDQSAEAITTPFSFIATASSLKWECINPVFADIDPATWCLAPENIESALTSQTRSIVPVHVFGNPCEVDEIEEIAKRYNLKVVYDASHAFGVEYKGESILRRGDASTLSFHATKIFHTIEGGGVVFRRKEDLERARTIINFGITGQNQIGELGINAKMNEFQAAMGLCVLDEMEANLSRRSEIWSFYTAALGDVGCFQQQQPESSRNYAYFPLLLNDEASVERAIRIGAESGVQFRRYFYPSLDTVEPISKAMPGCVSAVSREVAGRVLCLPMHSGLSLQDLEQVIACVRKV